MTLEEQVAQINAAIEKIEGGAQEYRTAAGRVVRRGDLATLYAERRRLAQEQAAYETNGGFYAASFYRG
ncbi:MAG: hypothetical protein RIN56_20665 [Sporomusaceae bacterium]|nr:hypothetical protein [Sporomusaceae bacterium]